ncbi:hypothetical protein [Paenibacillus sp. 32352]|uniref:hypothetical protein n=1 Tax=Paenibacillus sp. 32352 TaxID=1969111 RepID=UPI0009ADF7CF|nr:hypothetical protein [Paenibacillus sp. 32352]
MHDNRHLHVHHVLDDQGDFRSNRHLLEGYSRKAPPELTLAERLGALAQSRTDEGYMAETIEHEDGSLTL